MQGNVTNFKAPFSFLLKYQSTSQNPEQKINPWEVLDSETGKSSLNHHLGPSFKIQESEISKRNAGGDEGEGREETFTFLKRELILQVTLWPNSSFLLKVKASRTQFLVVFFDHLPYREAPTINTFYGDHP